MSQQLPYTSLSFASIAKRPSEEQVPRPFRPWLSAGAFYFRLV